LFAAGGVVVKAGFIDKPQEHSAHVRLVVYARGHPACRVIHCKFNYVVRGHLKSPTCLNMNGVYFPWLKLEAQPRVNELEFVLDLLFLVNRKRRKQRTV
jgi:hypothetical protein